MSTGKANQDLWHCLVWACLTFPLFACGCFCQDVPQARKLADCTTNSLDFRLAWPTGELFQIVLGVPYSQTNTLSFLGELVSRQSSGTVGRVELSSKDMIACNWLDNQPGGQRLAGYILRWSRTNAAQRLDRMFNEGEIYEFQLQFSELPPVTSTLWLHWLGQTR